MTDSVLAALAARIDRLEALDEIRQLAAKYTVALDMRDLDSLVNLFVDDVGVPGNERGRSALRRWYDRELRHDLLGSAHGVLGHVVDVHDADHAAEARLAVLEHPVGARAPWAEGTTKSSTPPRTAGSWR